LVSEIFYIVNEKKAFFVQVTSINRQGTPYHNQQQGWVAVISPVWNQKNVRNHNTSHVEGS